MKANIQDFVNFLTKGCDGKRWGYIMGATGQNPKLWSTSSWWFTQYTDAKQRAAALKCRETCDRVFDCNGLAEGYYKDVTGKDINTKARFNYSNWCAGSNGSVMSKMPRVPGVAVFIHSASAGYITHVGFLERPVDKSNPNGDWYVIEARGVLHGVVRTKFIGKGWNRWGLMSKYFDYANTATPPKDYNLGERTLKKGDTGKDVADLQSSLIALNYSCGKYGSDGEFGPATETALKVFQKDEKLTVNGIYDAKNHAALMKRLPDDPADTEPAPTEPPTTPEPDAPDNAQLRVSGNSINIRKGPGTNHTVVKVVNKGEVIANGWVPIVKDGTITGYISAKYVEVVG